MTAEQSAEITDQSFTDVEEFVTQPTPECHEKAVFVHVQAEDSQARFALTEEQAHALKDMIRDAVGDGVFA